MSSTEDDRRWYYVKDSARQGPINQEELKKLLLTGQLSTTDYVWHEGMQDWQEARAVQDLSATAPGPQPSPAPAPAFQQSPFPQQQAPFAQQAPYPQPGPYPGPYAGQPYPPQPGQYPPPNYPQPYPGPQYYGAIPQPVIPLDPTRTSSAQTIYILYLVGIFIPLFLTTIGVIIAYTKRGTDGPGMDTHYTWLIYTYWISWLWALIGVVTAIIVVGWFVLIFAWVWELIRCIQGLQRLSRNEGMPKPEDWFFAG